MTAFTLTPALWLVLDALAVMRLTRFVTKDHLVERQRSWLLTRGWTGAYDFVTCAWCTSVWLAALVVVATVTVSHQWQYVAYVLTCSAVAALFTERT